MNKINAEAHVPNHVKSTTLRRPSPSATRIAVIGASVVTVGLTSVPKFAHADPPSMSVPCAPQQVLVNAINSATPGAVLSLAQGCVYVLTSPINPPDPTLGNSGLLINKNLTIKGNGATITRTSAQKFRIFLVAEQHPPVDLTISDLTVDNGDTSGSATDPKAGVGGGILNLGILKITNSTFSRNHASFGGGGIDNGIPREDVPPTDPILGDLTLSDSVFFDNSGGIGAAIGNGAESTMTLTGCTISHNTATQEGGGVGNQGTAILTKCTISSNTVTSDRSDLIGGGGIINGGTLFLTDSLVSGNIVKPTGTTPFAVGGGLLNVSGAITLTHSDVTGNSATSHGGGIGIARGAMATLIDIDVTGNSTGMNGGGIANSGQTSLTRVNVTGNNASRGHGGGIANTTEPGHTIFLAAIVTLIHSDVTNNNATLGGGIFNEGNNEVTLKQSAVVFNKPADCTGVDCSSMSSAVSTSQ